jgi:predicted amidohydrolase YtcJ
MRKLYFGGTVLTMEEGRKAEAVLTEDGIITHTGSKEDLLSAAEDALQIDLNGACLLPGFIDPHSHYSQVASGLLQVSLDGTKSTEQIRERIRKFIRDNNKKEGSWILARDYDNNLFSDHQNLTLAQLDSLCPGYPLSIQHKSGHMGLYNSAALQSLGITDATPSPEGGNIGHENGHLTGYMEENAYFTYARKVPMPAAEELKEAYVRAQKLYASYGITTMQEGMLVTQMLPIYQMLYSSRLLKLDLVAYPDMGCFEAANEKLPQLIGKYSNHIRLGGIKIFLDGSPQGRTAWMRTPYQGEDPSYCGYGTLKDEEVCLALRLAAEHKVQLLAHCNGDAAAAQFIRCLAKEENEYPVLKQLRPVMIHAQLLGMDQIPEAAALGVIASFFVAHVYHWGDTHIRNFGRERASQISPAASALKTGLPFTFHQDSPVIRPNMLETIWCAANRQTKAGIILGEQERIPVIEALKAVTVNAAYQYFEENEKGSIRAGKKADFVILDKDPLKTPPEDLGTIKVLQTIKGGEDLL